jgi:hypothetical protein
MKTYLEMLGSGTVILGCTEVIEFIEKAGEDVAFVIESLLEAFGAAVPRSDPSYFVAKNEDLIAGETLYHPS